MASSGPMIASTFWKNTIPLCTGCDQSTACSSSWWSAKLPERPAFAVGRGRHHGRHCHAVLRPDHGLGVPSAGEVRELDATALRRSLGLGRYGSAVTD